MVVDLFFFLGGGGGGAGAGLAEGEQGALQSVKMVNFRLESLKYFIVVFT